MEKFTTIKKIIQEFYPSWETYVLESTTQNKVSAKLEDYGIVYTKDGKPIDMGHLKREMESAKTAIVSQSPLFAPYVHNFVPIYTWMVPTMATDGTRLFVNPAFANELTWEQKIFVIIHEIMHCVLLHMERLKSRDPKLFNIAGDYEINALIVDTLDSFTEEFVKEIQGLYDIKYLNEPVEKIYEEVKKNPPQTQDSPENEGKQGDGPKGGPSQGGGEPGEGEPGEGDGEGEGGEGEGDPSQGGGSPGQGQPGKNESQTQPSNIGGAGEGQLSNDPGGTGAIISAEEGKKIAEKSGYGDDEMGPDENVRDKWNVESGKLLRDLEKKAGSGKSSSALLVTLNRLHKGDVNWKALFRKYVSNALSPETYWKLGNKKHLGKDYMKRGLRQKTDAIKKIAVMVDTSGSMYSNPETIPRILNEINQIIFAKRVKKIYVVFFDGDVGDVQIIDNKGPSNTAKPVIKEAPIGGGTKFQPPLDWIHDELKDHIQLCVFVTDGDNSDSDLVKPKYANKFIWLIYDNPGFKNPWGKQINVTN